MTHMDGGKFSGSSSVHPRLRTFLALLWIHLIHNINKLWDPSYNWHKMLDLSDEKKTRSYRQYILSPSDKRWDISGSFEEIIKIGLRKRTILKKNIWYLYSKRQNYLKFIRQETKHSCWKRAIKYSPSPRVPSHPSYPRRNERAKKMSPTLVLPCHQVKRPPVPKYWASNILLSHPFSAPSLPSQSWPLTEIYWTGNCTERKLWPITHILQKKC